MAFKLTKDEITQRDALAEALHTKLDELSDAVGDYNARLHDLREPVQHALDAYNVILAQARGFCEGIARAAQEEFDGKTEKWQEGDKGSAAQDWISEWENIDMSHVEFDWPDDLEIDAPLHADDLEGLSTEVQA